MKIQAVKHKDIKGKELLYLIVEKTDDKKVIINVGEKTFKAVEMLLEEDTEEETKSQYGDLVGPPELKPKEDGMESQNNPGGRRNRGSNNAA